MFFMQMKLAFSTTKEDLLEYDISGNFGEENGGWHSSEVKKMLRAVIWKSIKREWNVLGENIAFSMENKERAIFWKSR